MAGTPYVPSSRLERVPPARASVAVAWAVDLIVVGVFFTATTFCLLLLFKSWALRPGDEAVSTRLHPGAGVLIAIAGILAATLATGLGKGQRSPGRQLAEIKTTDLAGPAARVAPAPARSRAAGPLRGRAPRRMVALGGGGGAAPCCAPAWSPATGAGWRTGSAGLRDYQTDLVPYRPDPAPGEAVASVPAPSGAGPSAWARLGAMPQQPAVCPVQVGRDEDVRALAGSLAALGRPGGPGRLVLISGDAGVGKSRLVAEVVREAESAA